MSELPDGAVVFARAFVDAMSAPARRRVGRDPEKVRAKHARWVLRNPGLYAALQSKYEAARRGRRQRTAKQKASRLARDRARTGATPRLVLHSAHVVAWEAYCRSCAALHDSHVRLFFRDSGRRYAWRYRYDMDFRLRELVRRQIRKKIDSKDLISELIRAALRRGGSSPSAEALLGWSIAELRRHLEVQLPAGVRIESLGVAGFHIDHIIPKRFYDLTTLEGVREYWALWNLRALPGPENLRKHERLEVDFIV